MKFAFARPQFFPPSANVSVKLVIPPRSLRHHTFVLVLEDQRSAILQRSLQAENLEVSMNLTQVLGHTVLAGAGEILKIHVGDFRPRHLLKPGRNKTARC